LGFNPGRFSLKLSAKSRQNPEISRQSANRHPARAIRYQHIDALFGGEIDWDLIATHVRDMILVALSIQAGRVMPSMLLRKLGTYSRRSLLYRAFRDLGRVERTLFLIRFVSSVEIPSVPKPPRSKPSTTSSIGSPSAGQWSKAVIRSSRRSSSSMLASSPTRSCCPTLLI
jgi:hypothetical protein